MPEPIQKTEELAREAESGRSERTPWLALSGVHIAVIVLFLAVFALAFTAYLIA